MLQLDDVSQTNTSTGKRISTESESTKLKERVTIIYLYSLKILKKWRRYIIHHKCEGYKMGLKQSNGMFSKLWTLGMGIGPTPSFEDNNPRAITTWSLNGKLANDGRLFDHLTAMNNSLAEYSYTVSAVTAMDCSAVPPDRWNLLSAGTQVDMSSLWISTSSSASVSVMRNPWEQEYIHCILKNIIISPGLYPFEEFEY